MTSVDTFRENVFCYVPYIQGFSAMSPNAPDLSFVKAEIDFDTCRIVFVTRDGAHEDRRAGLRKGRYLKDVRAGRGGGGYPQSGRQY